MPQDLDGLREALADRYAVERELGRGGMATVYLATDLKHHRPVALKVLKPELAAALGPERFLREIEVTAGLHHPHILPLYDSGVIEGWSDRGIDVAGQVRSLDPSIPRSLGLLYYVMPYVEGESLRDRLDRDRQLSLEEALQLTREVAEALGYAHAHGVIHRDIKPENILLENGHALVADFGIAKAVTAAGGERLTTTGISIGTPAYMSPEQATGSKPLDGRSDLYSLGCVLYEMLAGHPPFTGTTAHELLARHATDPVPPLRTGRATIPEPIEEAVEKALAKVPADRYATTQLFSDALQIDTAAYRKRQRTIKTVWRLLVAGVAGTAIVAAAYGAVVGRGPLRGLFAGGSAKVADPAWVLVADFEGPPEDPGLATAVRELASSAVEQSRWLTTVPSGDVTRARRLAEIPDTALLTLESARHLAYRTSVEMVLAGRVDRIQSSAYAVVVRMVATDDGRVLGSLTIETDDAHIVRDIVRLTADMLNRLPRHGEQRPRWTPSTLRTNSFEAFRLALDASQRNTVNDYAGAVDLAKRAVALDSGFADAWLNLGVYYTNLGWPDSARAAFEQARRHSSRLAPERTWFLTAMTATRTLDRIRAYEARVQQDPKAAGAYNNLGLFLQDLGRFDEARESFERGIAVSPFGPSPLILENYAALLAASGHGDSALAVIPTPQIQLHAAVGTGRWVVAESLASRVLGDPAGIARYRARGALVLASVEAVRGRVRSALEHFESVGTFDPNLSDWAKVLVAAATGTEPPAMPPVAGDTSVRALIKAGIASALAGSRGEAVRFQQMVRTRGLNDGYAEWRDARLLDAMIAAQEGHWRRAVELVSRIANEGGGAFGATPPLARWLTATAYRQLGQRDSAIAYLEPLVFPRRMAWWNLQYSGFVHSFALQRLVVLNAELGRVEDARRYWVLLRDTFTDPDPEYAHLISDAKAALEVAERAKG